VQHFLVCLPGIIEKLIVLSCSSVISIRTCYPQAPNGSGPATNRSSKLDMLFSNKVTAISLLKYYLWILVILCIGGTFLECLIASIQQLQKATRKTYYISVVLFFEASRI
jgi:hypothetical protein